MPNTPMIVGAGCSVYCTGSNATQEDVDLVTRILEVTGVCAKIPEYMINAVGAVASSGPAYVSIAACFHTKYLATNCLLNFFKIYLVIEALSDGGVKMGLPRSMANQFAAQTVLGAAKMVLETGKHPGELKDDVCSSGGTTIYGMHELEKCAVRGALVRAVEAAANRAVVMGKRDK